MELSFTVISPEPIAAIPAIAPIKKRKNTNNKITPATRFAKTSLKNFFMMVWF
jgi:hypothetical protein